MPHSFITASVKYSHQDFIILQHTRPLVLTLKNQEALSVLHKTTSESQHFICLTKCKSDQAIQAWTDFFFPFWGSRNNVWALHYFQAVTEQCYYSFGVVLLAPQQQWILREICGSSTAKCEKMFYLRFQLLTLWLPFWSSAGSKRWLWLTTAAQRGCKQNY